MPGSPSRWTMPLLRISMGLFLALWGVDKLVASAGAAHIFGHRIVYHVLAKRQDFNGLYKGATLIRTKRMQWPRTPSPAA